MRLVLEPFGDRAWRARLPEEYDVASRRRLLETLRALPGVVDGVVAERHALAVLEPGRALEGLREAIVLAVERAGADPETAGPRGTPRRHEIEVRYDGADLDEVAEASGLSAAEVVALHAGAAYEVAMMGFLPGFAYLRSRGPRLLLRPRRSTPRPRVPALSVAIAGPYTGIYPFASPGGWHLLGVAAGFVPFDAARGAALALGDQVRFVPKGAEEAP